MTAPATPTAPGEAELPDLWFPTGDPVDPETPIYGDDVVAAAEQENLAQTAIMAAALLEVIELFPLLDVDNLDASARGWVNRTSDVVMRARDRAFDRAVVDYDRFRAIRLGEEAAPASSLSVPLPTTPTRRPPPALPTLAAGETEGLPEDAGQSRSGRAQPSRQPTAAPVQVVEPPPTADEPRRSSTRTSGTPELPTLPPELTEEIRRQDRRRPKQTPRVELTDGPAERIAAARTPVVRPMKNGDAEPIVRRALTGAGPANIKHRTGVMAVRPTFPMKRDGWVEDMKRPVLVEVMGAAVKQIANGKRDAVDRMRQSDRVAMRYQRVVRGPNPCAFCIMLGGRGPVYRSEESAERVVQLSAQREIGEPYHDNCQCTSKVAYSPDEPWAGDNLAYRIAWDKYASGYERKQALLRFRRYIEGRDLNSGRTVRTRTPQARRPGQGTPASEVL